MQDMIANIVEADKRARKMIEEAERLRDDSDGKISDRCREIKKKHTNSADKRIEVLRVQEEKASADKLNILLEKSDKIVINLEKSYNENCDKWVEKIVSSITGGLIFMSGIAAPNAALTKSRAKYGQRLKVDDYNFLCSCRSISDITLYLKEHPAYSKVFADVNEKLAHRGYLESLLRNKILSDITASLCRYETPGKSSVSDYAVMLGDINQILNFLRMLSAGRQREYVLTMPRYSASHSTLDYIALSGAENFTEFCNVLKRSKYAKAIAPYVSNENDFDFTSIERALYGYMYSKLMEKIESDFNGSEKTELRELFGSQIDILNFLNIYRLKKYYNAEPERIKTVLFNNFYKLSGGVLEELIYANNGEKALEIFKTKTPYKRFFNGEINERYIDSLGDRVRYFYARKYMYYSVNSSVVTLSYLMLSHIEIKKIITIIECIRYGLSPEQTAAMIGIHK